MARKDAKTDSQARSNQSAGHTTAHTEGKEAAHTAEENHNLEGLDLENLDLTVEAVDERISPSETNVFDK